MSNHRSAGSFCSLVVSTATGTSDSVASLLAATYGDGAECYCVANTSVYRMNASLSLGSVGDTIIQANSGGGSWVKQSAQSDLSAGFVGSSLLQGTTISGLVVNTWQALPSGASFYQTFEVSNFWSLNATTGIMTYVGLAGPKFLVNVTVGVANTGTTPQTLALEFVTGGALIGGTLSTVGESRVTFPGIGGATTLMVYNTIISPSPGNGLQVIFRDLAAPNGTFSVDKYQVMITAL